MGISSSFLAQPCDLNELMLYLNDNDIKSFKEGIKGVGLKDLNKLLLETINTAKKEFFDLILDNIEMRIKSNPSSYHNSDYYDQCFSAIVNCSNPHFALRLIEVNKNVIPSESLLHIAVHFENEIVARQLILNGAEVNAFDLIGTTPLEEAIKCNNLELVCMLLYYGAYVNDLQNNLTSFMYSIICQSSEEIQRVLMEYEADFNLRCNDMSTLFFAIKYNSPVTSEIIKRGSDVNYCYNEQNAISLAMHFECDHNIFRILWENFDYEVWKSSYSKSVLLKFLQDYMSTPIWSKYLDILMENEAKLKLDLEHHNNSYFFKSDHLIPNLYLHCLENGIQRETVESLVLHLLSHGAHIFTEDIDIIYSELDACTSFVDLLLYMDLWNSDETFNFTFMYFKYTVLPDLETFMTNVAIFPHVLINSLKKLTKFYAFNNNLQIKILYILGAEELDYKVCNQILKGAVQFPSLVQLSRDSARKAICDKYNIKSSCNLYTIVRHLGLPKCIEHILSFDNCIYYYP